MHSEPRAQRARRRIYALMAGLFAAALVAVCTSGHGPGLDPDSLAYVGAAHSLVRHGRLRVPTAAWWQRDSTSALSRWPPGFSLALAIPTELGASQRVSEVSVLCLSAFATAVFLFLLLAEVAGTSAAVLGLLAIFLTPAILLVHLSALSEPLFLAAFSGTLLAMVRLRNRPTITGGISAIPMIVRYAGVCAPAAVVLWYFFERGRPLRERAMNALRAAAIPTIAVLGWSLRVRHLTRGDSGLDFEFYGNYGPTLERAVGTIGDWLAPSLAGAVQSVVVLAMAAGGAAVILRARKLGGGSSMSAKSSLTSAASLLLACYLAVLVLARMFAGATIPFDFRLLAPAILLVELLFVDSIAAMLRGTSRPVRIGAVLLLVVWLIGAISAELPIVRDGISDGLDFAGSDWRLSDTIDWIKSEGAGRTLYTNWPPPIYFYTGRVARGLPDSPDCQDLAAFRRLLQDRHGAFVAFKEQSPDYPLTDSLARAMNLHPEKQFDDGTIWSAPRGLPPLVCPR